MPQVGTSQVIRFATFEVDLQAQELRKAGLRLKLTGQPFLVLAILLERPGTVVTRDELQKRLWPDTFVDVDHNLNTAINKIREALGDSSENPRFVETLPRRGYRFIGPITANEVDAIGLAQVAQNRSTGGSEPAAKTRALHVFALLGAIILLGAGGFWILKHREILRKPPQRTLTRLTFDDGLQIGATWSPDGRLIAYSSDHRGKFDIWVQQVGGGKPVQVTNTAGQNWQPDWSPDGRYIAYRSEQGDGGLYVTPALGGSGLERKISSFGYYPRWSPDSTQILFQSMDLGGMSVNRFYVVTLDGSAPREVLKDITRDGTYVAVSAAWHPDSRRVSAWIEDYSDELVSLPSFWTVGVQGGTPVHTQLKSELVEKESLGVRDFKFCWAPSGRAIYFERTFRGARNLWRMTIEPKTLQAIGLERLTTGPEADTQLSLSPDGKKLAFTGASQQIRVWLFAFDANRGKVIGLGQPITSPGVEVLAPTLSPDGNSLSFSTVRTNHWEQWIKSFSDNQETLVPVDSTYTGTFPVWSPDGTRLAYSRQKLATGEVDIVAWSNANRKEEPLTGVFSRNWSRVCDWSTDGKSLLLHQVNGNTALSEIWEVSLAERPGESTVRQIASSRTKNLFQCKFSPDGRWIAFTAVENGPSANESALYAVPATGGDWIRLTDGRYWDDKPRWSPDGKTIYFISGLGGFYDLWGIHFDSSHGRALGQPFRAETFHRPSFMIPRALVFTEISITQHSLMVPVQQVSGGIWMLDHVDQ